jgi:hypothetical protein
MKNFALALTVILISSTAAAPGSEKAPPRNTIDGPASRSGCLDNTQLLSHTAYLSTATMQPPRCGHLLSTSTLLAVHHWDRT